MGKNVIHYSKNHIGRIFFIGIAGPEIDAKTEELLNEVRPGGVCLFARNIRSAEQTRQLTDSLKRILGNSLLISIDQEGGLVDRLKRILEPMQVSKPRNKPICSVNLPHELCVNLESTLILRR
ncbi:MAG: hypothetical protein C4325_00955 [Blastocatellia bacterium]